MFPSEPCDVTLDDLLLHRKRLRRQLAEHRDLQKIRIAVLGGTTTDELVDFLEILLLQSGLSATFYQSEYGAYYEDAVLEPGKIAAFKPDIIYLHTSFLNIKNLPSIACTEDEFN